MLLVFDADGRLVEVLSDKLAWDCKWHNVFLGCQNGDDGSTADTSVAVQTGLCFTIICP